MLEHAARKLREPAPTRGTMNLDIAAEVVPLVPAPETV